MASIACPHLPHAAQGCWRWKPVLGPPPVWKCPESWLGERWGQAVLSVQWFYLISCSFTVSSHDCWISCTKAVLRRTVPVRTPSWLKDSLIPDGRRRTLPKHIVCFCSRKKLWRGQVRNAFFQIFDVWHTALYVLAKFWLSIWLQLCIFVEISRFISPPPLLCRQDVSFMCFVSVLLG